MLVGVLRCESVRSRDEHSLVEFDLIHYRASQISAAMAACPDTKLIASGYSQGGQIVHNAAAQLPAATASWISKVVVFGDPGMISCLFKKELSGNGMNGADEKRFFR